MTQLFFINKQNLDPDMKRLGSYIRSKEYTLEINVKKAVKSKTKAQNSYYHHLIGLICKETGNNFEDLRFKMKIQLGYFDEIWVNGQAEKRVKSMSKVSIDQSNIFINTAIEMCEFLNIKMPSMEYHYEQINYRG